MGKFRRAKTEKSRSERQENLYKASAEEGETQERESRRSRRHPEEEREKRAFAREDHAANAGEEDARERGTSSPSHSRKERREKGEEREPQKGKEDERKRKDRATKKTDQGDAEREHEGGEEEHIEMKKRKKDQERTETAPQLEGGAEREEEEEKTREKEKRREGREPKAEEKEEEADEENAKVDPRAIVPYKAPEVDEERTGAIVPVSVSSADPPPQPSPRERGQERDKPAISRPREAQAPRRVTSHAERSWKEDKTNFRTGKFSRAENELIKSAMLAYVAEHGLGSDGLEKICNVGKHRNLRGAWLEIATCLPDRSVKLFKEQLDLKEGKWTDEEVQKLLELVKIHGRSWVVIGQQLGRTATSVRDKYKDCNNLGEFRKGRWSDEEEEALRKLVEKHRGSDGVISWAAVSAGLRTRNMTDCRCKWRLMQQTEKNFEIAKNSGWEKPKLKSDGTRPRTTNPPRDITILKDLKLLEELYKSGAEDSSEVVWSRLGHPQARTRWNQLKRNVPDDWKFSAAVEKLYSDLQRRVAALPANKRRLFSSSGEGEEGQSTKMITDGTDLAEKVDQEGEAKEGGEEDLERKRKEPEEGDEPADAEAAKKRMKRAAGAVV